jgi:uncharacterized protein YcaQ
MIIATKESVIKFLINRAYLGRKLFSLDDYFQKFHVVQVDPINVVARSHELVLWNRIANFKRSDLNSALYGKNRSLFEYWLQLYSIIDLRAYPYLKAKRDSAKHDDSWQTAFAKNHSHGIQAAIEYVKSKGEAVGSKELSHLPAATNFLSWKQTNSRKALLEYLWDTGDLVIDRRQGNNKLYGLAAQLLPAGLLQQQVSTDESLDFILKSYFDYLGLVRSAMLNRTGRSLALALREKFKQALQSGQVQELQVAGIKTKYYVWESEWQEYLDAQTLQVHSGVSIMAPLDPLVIDRQMLVDFFDFFYRWEVYTPSAKRTVGYYNMPILYEGQFKGQIALFKDKQGRLQLEKLHLLELNKPDAKRLQTLLDQEVTSLQKFIDE